MDFFSRMDKDMFTILYKSLIRLQLEKGDPIWSPCYSKDKIKLQNVNMRATKILPQLQNMSYTDQLKELGIPSLEYRKLRSDLIQVYTIKWMQWEKRSCSLSTI